MKNNRKTEVGENWNWQIDKREKGFTVWVVIWVDNSEWYCCTKDENGESVKPKGGGYAYRQVAIDNYLKVQEMFEEMASNKKEDPIELDEELTLRDKFAIEYLKENVPDCLWYTIVKIKEAYEFADEMIKIRSRI